VPVELVSGLGVRGAAFGANRGIYLNGHVVVAAALAE
jgi:hypothetical protein